MPRYIDRDKLMAELDREVELADDWKTAHEIANVVKYFPTADVVDVVRCKECVFKNGDYCHNTSRYYGTSIFVQEYDFCSRGERREDADN